MAKNKTASPAEAHRGGARPPANASNVKALQERALIHPIKGRDPLTICVAFEQANDLPAESICFILPARRASIRSRCY